MRTEIELLNLMLGNQHLFFTGLCSWVWSLERKDLISFEERELLLKTISVYKPRNQRTIGGSWFYWIPEQIKPRIAWINRTIKKLENLK
jgi:hypothetical protein